jgi:hypothetical protein
LQIKLFKFRTENGSRKERQIKDFTERGVGGFRRGLAEFKKERKGLIQSG